MKSTRSVLTGTLLSAAMVAAAAGYSMASAADGVASIGTPAASQTDPGPHHWHGGPERLFKQLNLTADQQQAVKSLWVAAKPQMQSLHEQSRANHLKLMQTKPDDPNYPAVVQEVSAANATLASRRTTEMAELRQQMYAVLTPTQKTQLATLEAQRLASPQRGHWGHRAPGAMDAGPDVSGATGE